MKNILIATLLFFCAYSYAQRKPKIKGNKNVIDVVQDLPSFSKIELNDDLDITLKRGNVEGYAITADDNLIDVLKLRVVNGTLKISSFYKITRKKKLDIVVSYVDLNTIVMRTGRIRMKDIVESEELYVNTFEDSKLELNAQSPYVEINMEGNSSGNFNIDSDSLQINLKDRIDVSIYSTSSTNSIFMTDTSSAKMDGTTDVLTVKLLGSSNLKAERLQSSTVSATLSESPSARVYASDTIELSSSGSSKTYFYGDGKMVLLDFLDTSELHKKKN
ncbi:DUF2807 domain-containing protein [uncultured Maribacter sp.]|uniref:GIN domain-containing protein n=1 Tax=uncultured Maribacter sp. TaxID=431308 RepID=UPI002629992B|nr:DUF2807 domain-containing protein [uncultured Maribacter sp.]